MSDSAHGDPSFDKEYYHRFFNTYDNSEFKIYENWFRGWERFIFGYFNKNSNSGKKVIEIGCSIGAFTKILKERGFDVTATDISKFIIEKARRLQKDVKFEVYDIEKDKKSEKFDYVFAFEVVEHLNNPSKALSKIYNLLKNGGVFIFSTPFPSKQSLADPTHINVHEPTVWLQYGKQARFSKRKYVYLTFVPYLYRFSQFFSRGFPIKIDLPYVNSTSIFMFEK